MNSNVINNYSKLNTRLFILPSVLLIIIVLFLYSKNALNTDRYIEIQKGIFFFVNHYLGQYPNLQHNLTQFGDGLVFLALLSIFVMYAPKIWEALLSGLLVAVLLSGILKRIFRIPRPARILDNDSFIIIGKKLLNFKSLPSGHSITVFTILTILMFAFMPKKSGHKIIWCSFLVVTGLVFAFTRVGVGAHFPIDVVIGCIIGYVSGILGIFISRKYKIWNWMNHTKYYLFLIVLFLIGCALLVNRIANYNLIIFYLAFISLLISLYKIIIVYAKSIKK